MAVYTDVTKLWAIRRDVHRRSASRSPSRAVATSVSTYFRLVTTRKVDQHVFLGRRSTKQVVSKSSGCQQQSQCLKFTPMILFTWRSRSARPSAGLSSLMFDRRASSCKSVGKGVIFRIDPDEEQRRNAGLRLYTFWIEPTRLLTW